MGLMYRKSRFLNVIGAARGTGCPNVGAARRCEVNPVKSWWRLRMRCSTIGASTSCGRVVAVECSILPRSGTRQGASDPEITYAEDRNPGQARSRPG